MEAKKFRKKPVVVEATKWMAMGDHPAVFECYFDAAGMVRWAPGAPQEINIHGCRRAAAIRTLEGWHEVKPGDWVIKGVAGELYPCKPEIFAKTYELAEPIAEGLAEQSSFGPGTDPGYDMADG